MEDQLSKDPKLKERTKWKPKQIKRLAEVCFETHFVFINGRIRMSLFNVFIYFVLKGRKF